MALLALEGVVLTLALILVLQRVEVELFFIFLIVRMGACEARLGLACLVSIMRAYGNDHISALRGAK